MAHTTESLSELYMMTGQFDDHIDFKNKLSNALSQSNKVVQLRKKNIENSEYLALAKIAESVCRQFNSILLLAASIDIFTQAHADGLHLNSRVLFEYDSRPIAEQHLLSVSCHNLEEMTQAEKLGADILLLSPVKATSSHPELEAIGWQKFKQMIAHVQCPVYALGGMQASDLTDAKQAGAKGIAVSSFWK
ncbi:MAG: thiamine phosphate synthase [Gammaproteobacteria bacterium]|nr:thiamine phosphate synthase [Gammaproteobacteria bacterium]